MLVARGRRRGHWAGADPVPQTIEAETGEEGVRLAHERHPTLIRTDGQVAGGIERCLRASRMASRILTVVPALISVGHRSSSFGDMALPVLVCGPA